MGAMPRFLSSLCLLYVAAPPSFVFAFVSLTPKEGWAEQDWWAWEGMEDVLRQSSESRCSSALLTDAHTPTPQLLQSSGGRSVFVAGTSCEGSNETSSSHLLSLLRQVYQIRKRSWCLTVVVLVTATCQRLLAPLAEACMATRLLAGDTRLFLVLRDVPYSNLTSLLAPHWPFTMATTIVLNVKGAAQDTRATLFLYQPYTSVGPRLLRVEERERGRHQYLIPPSSTASISYRINSLTSMARR
ncbi:uncharacterized protein LOC123507482 [Portunus trituberculatus]|uniref:uncharacterized protein LOC123507482 n=1 Tax=Portunus trituberculatus TaxID=210409 RepID=UPI001E1CFB07|nr:uncharacterized protein LOC123507482 [Portunus trituberculatus]